MQRFVARHNVGHFRLLLETEKDPQQRIVLERLLGEELAKLAAAATSPEPDAADQPADAPRHKDIGRP